jgi:Tfp pilus assembly protein FimT
MDPRRTRLRTGFTLLEILVIIVIIGIIARIATSRLMGESFRVAAQARELATSLAASQRLAVSLQNDVRVTFDAAQRRIEVHEDRDNDGFRDAGERVRIWPLADNMLLDKGGAPDLVLQTGGAASSAVTFTNNVLVFHRDGSASQAGAVFVRSGKDPATTARVRAIEIVRVGGRPYGWAISGSGAWHRAQ